MWMKYDFFKTSLMFCQKLTKLREYNIANARRAIKSTRIGL